MPYYTDLPDTLIVDGADLQALTGITINDLDLLAPGTRRGSDDIIPGRDGQLGAPLPLDAYSFSVPITVDGGTDPGLHARRATMLATLRAAIADIGGMTTGGLVTLTRRLAKVGGGYDEHTAPGRFVAANTFSLIRWDTGRTELEFVNLAGAWSDGTDWLVP